MRFAHFLATILLSLSLAACGTTGAPAQATLLQSGPVSTGHAPMYVNSGTSQPVVQDSGTAAGGAPGVGLSELGLTARGTGTPPYAGQGKGPLGTNLCDYDAPVTNATGYHYFCLSPNAQGGGLMAYGHTGAAAVQPFNFNINGTSYQFPFSTGGIVGPNSSTIGNFPCWANTVGTLLSDCGNFEHFLDAIGSTQGSLLYRGASAWSALGPGTSGQVLQSGGAGANPAWAAATTGTVTSIATGTGLTGGTITSSGTISMANMAANTVKCNATLASAAPQDCSGAPQITAKTYGVSMSAQSVSTATCVATSASVALGGGGAIDFANGQGVALEHCGATFAGSAPTGFSVVAQQSPAGATTYAYQIACVDDNGGVGAAVSAVTITNGAATLGAVVKATRQRASNLVSWTQNSGCTAEAVWRSKSGGAYVLVAVIDPSAYGQTGINDFGLTTVTTMPWVPATPPASAVNDRFVGAISSGGGTSTLILTAPVTNSATSVLARHDDTAALNAYAAAQTTIAFPAGTANVEAITLPSTVQSVIGAGRGATTLSSWTTSKPALKAPSMPSGFSISALTITGLSFASTGLEIDGTTSPSVTNTTINGGTWGVHVVTGNNGLVFTGNIINWNFFGIVDPGSAQRSTFRSNLLNAGQFIGSGQCVVLQSNNTDFSYNTLLGGCVFGINIGAGVGTSGQTVNFNYLTGTGAEILHASSGSSNWTFEGNIVLEPATHMDFCMSITDDAGALNVGSGIVTGNYFNGCGESAVEVISGGSGAASISYITITNNLIINANADLTGGTSCAIGISGANVSNVTVFGNSIQSVISGDTYAVCDDASSNSNTFGTNYGNAGTTAFYSLAGTGDQVYGIAPASTFAKITTCNTSSAGLQARVTNSNTNTWGANIAGGGANVVQGFCDGSNWTVMGK